MNDFDRFTDYSNDCRCTGMKLYYGDCEGECLDPNYELQKAYEEEEEEE